MVGFKDIVAGARRLRFAFAAHPAFTRAALTAALLTAIGTSVFLSLRADPPPTVRDLTFERYGVRLIRGVGGAGRLLFIPSQPGRSRPKAIPCPTSVIEIGLCVEID